MSITVTTDMKYTRSGEAGESNVLSAHNAIIWLFEDDAIAAAATATIDIVVKNNAGSTIYTSPTFPAYLLDGGGGSDAHFRFDATEIIRHIINNYFYKETASILEPENYGSEIEVTIKTYDAAVLEDTELVEYFACHAINQIGDEYGANIPRIFYNDTEEIAHFLGFPNHAFFYAPTTLAADDPLIQVMHSALTDPDNLISTFTNDGTNPYETLSVPTDTTIASAINTSGQGACNSDTFAVVSGRSYVVIIPNFTLNLGEYPYVKITKNSNGADISNSFTVYVTGGNPCIIILTATADAADAQLTFFNSAASNWSAPETIEIRPAQTASIQGTLGLFMHDLDIGLLELSKFSKYIHIYNDLTDPTLIKTFNLNIFEPCSNAVYIRFLTRDGIYMYWAFSAYPFETVESENLGKIINAFDEQATANSRHFPVGRRMGFKRLIVSSASVPIVFRRKLMDLFTSPAVYYYQGKQTTNENLISSFANAGYETFSSSGVIITQAIETGSSGGANSDSFDVLQGEIFIISFILKLNSGTVPTIKIVSSAGAEISNAVVSANGYNQITLTVTADGTGAKLQFRSTAATNFATQKILAKRAESETDWILIEGIEGSHELREKKQADNFECTLVFPERFTQKLSGQNI